jgi:hypothetical protein
VKRRILLGIFVTVATAATICFGLWYSGYLEERDCARSGGTWITVTKKCFVQ